MKYKLNSDYDKIYNNILSITSEYIRKSSLKSVVIGLSGGIDSALAVALLHDVKNEFKLDIKIIGLSLPIKSNKPDEIKRSKSIGELFCDEFEEVDLTETYEALLELEDIFDGWKESYSSKVRLGNIKARLRMIKLYDTAQENNGMVLSTDNLTEYMLGFWTLHGDVGDYGMFQNLWKTEVHGLSKLMIDNYAKNELYYKAAALDECKNAIPTDGLGISESDFDQLGCDNYQDIDKVLIKYLNNELESDYTDQVIERHISSEHKRNNPNNIPREKLLTKEG